MRDPARFSRRGAFFVGVGTVAAQAMSDHASAAGAAMPALPMMQAPMSLLVNGKREAFSADLRVTLRDALRENLGLTGSKKGCDHGQCGAYLAGGTTLLDLMKLDVMHPHTLIDIDWLEAAHGKITALVHTGDETSSRPDSYKVGGTDITTRMYDIPNITSRVTIQHADRDTPGFMRAPAEMPHMFALESAMDALAVALTIDPVERLRVNDAQVEPVTRRPFSSRSLNQIYAVCNAIFHATSTRIRGLPVRIEKLLVMT